MHNYKINFSLLTLFSLLTYIFCGRGLKGRAGCRQKEVQADKQTDDLCLLRQRIGEQTKSRTYAKNWRNWRTDRRSLSRTPKNWRTYRQVNNILLQEEEELTNLANNIIRPKVNI